MNRIILIAGLFLLLLSATPGEDGGGVARNSAGRSNGSLIPSGVELSAIATAIDEKRKELNVPGVSVVIVKDDKVIFIKGFGLRDVEHNLPVTPDTIVGIGSCTKAFTAMAAVISEDEGKLSIDDSPRKYLPYFKLHDPDADAKVTIRDLLSHRTGVPDKIGTYINSKTPREDVIKAAMVVKPTAKLGEKFQYNNVMYSAAGEAVARAQGSTWEAVIAEKIFKPLGMTASNTSIQETYKTADYTLGYHVSKSKAKQVKLLDLNNIAGAGAINSNATDMAKWIRLMLNGGWFDGKRLVSEKNFAQLITKQIKASADADYCLGWGRGLKNGKTFITHTGGTDGFTTLVDLMPEEKIGWAILLNVDETTLHSEIRKIIIANLVESAKAKANSH